jgi:hypothetical protein
MWEVEYQDLIEQQVAINGFLGDDDLKFCEGLKLVNGDGAELEIKSYDLAEAIRKALEREFEEICYEIEAY